MKRIFIVCLITTVLFSFGMTVSAEEALWEPDLTAEMTDEFREVMKNANFEEVALFLKNNHATVEYENAMEMHGFKTDTLITAYNDSGKKARFGELISEHGGWFLPITTDEGREVLIVGGDLNGLNKWNVIFGHPSDIFTDPIYAEYASIFTQKSFEKTLPDGAEYKIVQMPVNYGSQTVVYYEVNGTAFLRPLDATPYGVPLKLGEVYEADKLLEEWSKKYVDKEVELADAAGGGTGYELVEKAEITKGILSDSAPLFLIVGIFGIILAVIGLILVLILRRKKT